MSQRYSEEFEEPNMKTLEGLTNYLDVLVESYPDPINSTQLADKAGVSKAAVSKVGDRLFYFCSHKMLAYKRFILRTDDVPAKLFVLYITKLKPARFLNSRYGIAVLHKIGIHAKIKERFPDYSLYFDESDTDMLIRICVHNLDNLKIEDKISATIEGIQNKAVSVSMNYLEAFGVLINQFDLPLKNTEDLFEVLRIRDKGFFLAKLMILNQVKRAGIITESSDADKEKYIDVYSGTIDYYLKKALSTLTDLAQKVAQKKGIEFKEEYRKIGYFYSIQEV
jgi:hypothetical protein